MANGVTQVFCDESGFSGNNLLDQQQPYFVYASVVADEANAKTFVDELIQKFGIQGGELKGSRMIKFNKGRQAVREVLETYGSRARLAVHEKRFALAGQFFEYVFEPALAQQNSIFYGANFHRFIAGIVYKNLMGGDQHVEQILTGFSTMMRRLDITAFNPLGPSGIVGVKDESILDQIALFALLNKRAIEDELAVLYGDGSAPNWVLDLTTTSLFQILSELGKGGPLEVFCDESKPLLANRTVFDAMLNREAMSVPHRFWGDRPFGFNLACKVQFVNSATYAGIQLADVIAAATSYIFTHRREDMAQAWLELLGPNALVNGILPDLEYANPHMEDGFVGGVILHELVKRSLAKHNFFDGMPMLIEAARESFRLGTIQRHRR